MAITPKKPTRTVLGSSQDLGATDRYKYNDAAGADKVMIVQPEIVKATLADERVGSGKLIKVAATGVYSLKTVGIDYNAANKYAIGDMVVQAGKVYQASADQITGAFDASLWQYRAEAVIAGIPCLVGDIVTTGTWHNAISVAGFLVEDETYISHKAQRN